MPRYWTKPLTPDFKSDGDRLIQFADIAWKADNTDQFKLSAWQRWFIRHALELRPDGTLRYRQLVINISRQQGKSTLMGLLALYGLLFHEQGPHVIGIASNADQARIIYRRVMYVINANPELKALFRKITETRGIQTADGAGTYELKASKSASLQGQVVSLGLADELHIMPPELWDDLVNGAATRRRGLIVGATTAGDDSSVLLKRLMETGRAAAGGEAGLERFGYFEWSAPEGCAVDDPQALRAAAPALVTGELDLDTVLTDVRSQPESSARRYRLNQMTASEGTWLPNHLWAAIAGEWPVGVKPTHIALDRDSAMRWSTITTAVEHQGRFYTRVVLVREHPSLQQMEDDLALVKKTAQAGCVVLVAWNNQKLYDRLNDKGWNVERVSGARVGEAAATTYQLISQDKVVHVNGGPVAEQLPHVRIKTEGGQYKMLPAKGQNIDAVYSTVMSIYGARNIKLKGLGVY